MSDDFYFTEESIQKIKDLMRSPVFDSINRQEQARNLRNEVEADWISNFMSRMQQQTHPHAQYATVESVVDELRSRVKLDAIAEKTAAVKSGIYPISFLVANADNMEEIKDFIRNHLSSHRGYSDVPAIMSDIRDKFGMETVDAIGKKKIEAAIKELKDSFGTQDISSLLGSQYTGEPQKADMNEIVPIFPNIKVK